MAEPETVPAVYRQLHELGLRLHAAAKEFDSSREDGRRSSVITSIGTGIFSLGCGGTLTRLREFSETGKWSGLLHLVIELVRNWCLHRLPSECGAPIQKWEETAVAEIDPSGDQRKKLGKRGRPKGTFTRPAQFLQDIWMQVGAVRERTTMKTGRRHSVAQVCNLMAQRGGLVWAVGGNIDAIASAMELPERPYSKWRRFHPERKGDRYVTDDNGRLIVSHLCQHDKSLRTRYTEADRLVRNNPAIRAAWTNMVRDMLGLPRIFPV